MATDSGLASDRLLTDIHPREMPVAFGPTGYRGFGHPLQSGARFVPSMLLHCLSSQEILSKEKMDGCVFRRAMGYRHTSFDSGSLASETRKILLSILAPFLILRISF